MEEVFTAIAAAIGGILVGRRMSQREASPADHDGSTAGRGLGAMAGASRRIGRGTATALVGTARLVCKSAALTQWALVTTAAAVDRVVQEPLRSSSNGEAADATESAGPTATSRKRDNPSTPKSEPTSRRRRQADA
jgi:hypothetical protein